MEENSCCSYQFYPYESKKGSCEIWSCTSWEKYKREIGLLKRKSVKARIRIGFDHLGNLGYNLIILRIIIMCNINYNV